MTPERLQQIKNGEIAIFGDGSMLVPELVAALEEAWARIERLTRPDIDDSTRRLIRYYAGKDALNDIENDRDGILNEPR